MTEKDLIEKQKINEMIQGFTLMDDDFMTSFFEDNKECTQFILRTILDKDDLVVIENITQRYIKNLEGRSPTAISLILTFISSVVSERACMSSTICLLRSDIS